MKKLLKTAALTGGILFAVKGLDNRIEVTHYDISSPKIPEEFDGYKILQISDYHADSVPGLIEEIEQESPDIIVSTGDLVHDTGSYTPGVRLCRHLIDISPVAKSPKISKIHLRNCHVTTDMTYCFFTVRIYSTD